MLISKLNLHESFVCSIWENSDYYSGLTTTDGEDVEIIDFGARNFDAGPDYSNSVVSIGGRIFKGSVEIHRESGDWHRHLHSHDPNYSEVILHVAMYDDSPPEGPSVTYQSRQVPTVILSRFLSRSVREILKELIRDNREPESLPCHPSVLMLERECIGKTVLSHGLARLAAKQAKLYERTSHICEKSVFNEALEQVAFEYLCEALGYSKNKKQFMRLARNIDIAAFRKHGFRLSECDAILFGMAGFLNQGCHENEYVNQLTNDWGHLRNRYCMPQFNSADWNFFRLRPSNFPTLRLAYASGLLSFMLKNNITDIIRDIFINSADIELSIDVLLKGIEISQYWDEHYHFGKAKKNPFVLIGDERVADITVNVLVPLALIACRDFTGSEERIAGFYLELKANASRSKGLKWLEAQTGFKAGKAAEQQGLIQLYQEMCAKKKCGECNIGRRLSSVQVPEEPLKIILY